MCTIFFVLQLDCDDKHSERGECFFSQSYEEARARFRGAALEAGGFELHNYTVKERDGRALTTDIAIFAGRPDRVLVHLSGTHGPEGYVGSAIQTSYLSYLDGSGRDEFLRDYRNELPTQIFVHAVNPFGFAYNRRVNEENIDLNRNFLSPKEFQQARARPDDFAGYATFDHLLNPTSLQFSSPALNKLYNTFLTLKAIASNGLLAIKRAMVTGNYHKPTGLYYGGKSMTTSTRLLIEFLEDYFANTKEAVEGKGGVTRAVFVDVHSGLGPSGIDTLNMSPESADLAYATFHDISAMEREQSGYEEPPYGIIEFDGKPGNAAMAGYEDVIGGTTEYFCGADFTPWAKLKQEHSKLCVVQEFGTVAPQKVGEALVQENYAWHFDPSLHAVAGAALRDVFYVDTATWKRSVHTRGIDVIQKSLQMLTGDKLPLPLDGEY